MNKSYLETILEHDLLRENIPYEREVRLIPGRKFSYDFVFPEHHLVVEIEGGTWSSGKSRHTEPKGFERDCTKYNAATALGWSVLRFTSKMVCGDKTTEPAWKTIKRFIEGRNKRGQEAHSGPEGEGSQG